MITKIALSGLPNVGKDTVKKLLHKSFSKRKTGYWIYDIAFADQIKYFSSYILGREISIEDKNLYGESKYRNEIIPDFSKNNNISYRDLLNDLGELFRSYHPDFWINFTFKSINKNIELDFSHHYIYLITDLRRVNEYQRLKEEGFFLIRIKRPNTEISMKENLTELNLFEDDKFDYVINNDGSENDLEKKVEDLVDYLLKN